MTFVFLTAQMGFSATLAAIAAIVVTLGFRGLTIAFNWRTSAVAPPENRDVLP